MSKIKTVKVNPFSDEGSTGCCGVRAFRFQDPSVVRQVIPVGTLVTIRKPTNTRSGPVWVRGPYGMDKYDGVQCKMGPVDHMGWVRLEDAGGYAFDASWLEPVEPVEPLPAPETGPVRYHLTFPRTSSKGFIYYFVSIPNEYLSQCQLSLSRRSGVTFLEGAETFDVVVCANLRADEPFFEGRKTSWFEPYSADPRVTTGAWDSTYPYTYLNSRTPSPLKKTWPDYVSKFIKQVKGTGPHHLALAGQQTYITPLLVEAGYEIVCRTTNPNTDRKIDFLIHRTGEFPDA